jgi:hypothetical protein
LNFFSNQILEKFCIPGYFWEIDFMDKDRGEEKLLKGLDLGVFFL